jgi:uncharacterized protein
MNSEIQYSSPNLRNITIQTTTECNIGCKYCYVNASQEKSYKLRLEDAIRIFDEITLYQSKSQHNIEIKVVFHGGEPLLLGCDFYDKLFTHIANLQLNNSKIKFSLSFQSNITLLDRKFCQLFKDYNVSIGTSLDGSEHIHNYNRRGGKYRNNHAVVMEKIDLAREYGIKVGAICTVTKDKLDCASEIFEFFEDYHLDFKTNKVFSGGRAASNNEELMVSELEYSEFLVNLFDVWYDRPPVINVDNLVEIIGILLKGRNMGGCTRTNCSQQLLTISSMGNCYTCGRMGGVNEFVLGNILKVGMEKIASSEVLKLLSQRSPDKIIQCSSCDLLDICNSGCMYDAYLSNGTIFSPDGNCDGFRRVCTHIKNRMVHDILSINKR